MAKETQNAWSVPLAIEDIPEAGLHLEIEAPGPALDTLTALASVRGIKNLYGTFDVTRRGAGIHVYGTVKAQVAQTCVISLEPVESEVNEAVDLLFVPEAQTHDESETELDATETEPPEPLIGGKIDLAAITSEFLLLGIDPYPRKPGIEFKAPEVENSGNHPFAALEALKKGPFRS
jgi:uncharacterized metal-binding protein YceD (DUF177 family)